MSESTSPSRQKSVDSVSTTGQTNSVESTVEQLAVRSTSLLEVAFSPVSDLLTEEGLVEVACNPDGKVWSKSFGENWRDRGIVLSEIERIQIIRLAADDTGTTITAEAGIISKRLNFNHSRFTALIGGVQAPTFSLRRHLDRVLTLDDYLADGFVTAPQYHTILETINSAKSIMIGGSTGVGKTTFLNALVEAIPKSERIITIEDTAELQVAVPNSVQFIADDYHQLDELVVASLRYSPDRVILGEVRKGDAAFELITACNTGHSGLTTIHSNSAADALTRMETALLHVLASPPYRAIATAIDLIIYLKAKKGGVFIEDILSVDGYVADAYQTEKIG